jgi:hypothetical protein
VRGDTAGAYSASTRAFARAPRLLRDCGSTGRRKDAAGLLGIKVDCTELLLAGESGDEEASAASRALTILRKRWGGKTFTTRDVVQVIEGRNNITNPNPEQGEELLDALGELVGKTLEHPTAHSIGKLFQKHLTGKPAWIEGGPNEPMRLTAKLRKIAGHQANAYHVEIVPSTGEAQAHAEPQGRDESSGSSRGESPIF